MRAKEVKKRKAYFKEFGQILVRRHGQNYYSSYNDQNRITVDEAAVRFGRYLRAARVNSGLSIAELAARTSLSEASLTALEHGIILACDIRPKWLKELAEALGENVEDFNLLLGRNSLESRRWSWLGESWIGYWLNISYYAPKQNLFRFIYSEFNSFSKPVYAICSALLICFTAGIVLFLSTTSFDQAPSTQPEAVSTPVEAKATTRPVRRFTMERTEFDIERQALVSPTHSGSRWSCCIY
jgi:transcriptional regulator with XRE-family HTH domain